MAVHKPEAISRWATGYGRRFRCCNAVTRVVLFGCLGMALFGYDTGVVSGAMVLVKQDIELDTVEVEEVVSITLVCSALSTVLGIPLNSMFGRKAVIMCAAILYIAGSIVIGLAEGFWHLFLGRAILGIAIGLASGTVPMYSAELAPPKSRGSIVTLTDLNIVFGQLLAALVNVAFKDVASGWRYSMGLAAAPAAVLLLGFVFLPESPRWLALKGRLPEAEAVLQMITDKAEDVPQCLADIQEAVQREEMPAAKDGACNARLSRSIQKLTAVWCTKEVRRAAVLGIGLMAMQQLSGINTVMYYSTTILLSAGFSRDASIWLAALCCAAQMLGVGISVLSMDRHGRRKTALRSTVGVGLTLTLLSIAFECHGDVWNYVEVVALVLYLVSFGAGLSGVPWVINAEIYPARVRAVAVGQATFFNWLANWFVGRYFLSLCAWLGTGGAFSVFAGFSVVGGLWLYCVLPETAGKSLEEIENLFRENATSQSESESDPTEDSE